MSGPWVYITERQPHAKRALPSFGFTIVEILIVLGVISILAALLVPVLLSAKEQGRQSVCISNLRQIAGALQMYQIDHGDRAWPWKLDLGEYVADTDLVCPDAPGKRGYASWNILWDEPATGEYLKRKARERGPMYPVVFCIRHIRWGIVPVLRADGSVHRRVVPRNCSIGVMGPSEENYVSTPDL